MKDGFDVADEIEQLIPQINARQVTLLMRHSLLESELSRLVLMSGVTSVLVEDRGEPVQTSLQPCIYRFRFADKNFTFPRLSRTILLDYALAQLPSHFLFALYRSGARTLIELEAVQPRQRKLLGYLVYRLSRAAALLTIERIDLLQPRSTKSNLGLAAKVLRGACRSIRFNKSELAPADLISPPLWGPEEFCYNRILMINSALAWGGAERQLVNTMIGLSHRHYDVSLACENLGLVPDSDFFEPELKRHQIPYGSLWCVGRAGKHNGYLERLPGRDLKRLPSVYFEKLRPYIQAIKAVRPAVIHAWQDQTCVLAGVAAAIVGVPRIILSTRNVAPVNFAYHQPHMRSAYRALSTHPAVRFINNSNAGAADYAKWLDLPISTFTVVYNGFDFDREAGVDARPSAALMSNAPIIGSIFRFYSEKDPLLWIETATIVARRRPDAHFVIAGTGPLEQQVRALARRKCFGDRLHLMGVVRDPTALLRRLSVFLLTSRFEGLPNVLIEAQAHGVPVVSSRAGGAGEAFVQGETGWLVEERSPEALAERVLNVLDDSSWRAQAAIKARRFVRETFSLESMLDQTVALYDIGHHRSSAKQGPGARSGLPDLSNSRELGIM